MRIKPLTTNIGAEISDIDLTRPLDISAQRMIYGALLDHLVIFFRDQDISPLMHIRFAESFGVLDVPHPIYAHVEGYENVVLLANDAGNPPDTNGWHTDLTFKEFPPFASILVAREVPAIGGDTVWSSLYSAYDSLTDSMRSYLSGLKAVHDMGDFRNNFTLGEESGDRLSTAMKRMGCYIHDIVKTHPVSGRKFLYVNESFTNHVVGLTSYESRNLLDYLFKHMNRPEFQVRFKWEKHSIAMWDNRCTQHYAVADYLPHYRCMHRVTVIEDKRALGDQ